MKLCQKRPSKSIGLEREGETIITSHPFQKDLYATVEWIPSIVREFVRPDMRLIITCIE